MRIGFIGLGVMGKSMAMNILKGGYELTVFDVVKENVDELVKKGAKSGATPSEVATQSDMVLTSLPNAAIVEQVFLGENGILEGMVEGAIYVDLSSITPKSIRYINEMAKKKSVSVVDAPVSGGAEGAEKGTLTIMVGGEQSSLEKVLPVLNCIGKEIKHVGSVGAGDTVKAVNNLLLGANMVAVAEALVLGKKAGLDPDVMFEIISKSSGSSYALTAKYEKYISKGNFNPGFMVNLMHKDLQLAIDTAKDLNYPLLYGNIAQQMFEIAKTEGMGQEDISSVVKIFERWANVEVRSEENK